MNAALAVALGGALGSLARYALGLALQGWKFPYATLTVNVLGSLAMGALVAWLAGRSDLPLWLKPGLSTGVLGGFTTFSALAIETLLLAKGGSAGLAAANVLLNIGLGLLACGLGYRLVAG